MRACVYSGSVLGDLCLNLSRDESTTIQGKGQAAEVLLKDMARVRPQLTAKVQDRIDGCVHESGAVACFSHNPIAPTPQTCITQVKGLVRLDDTHVSDRQVLQLARHVLLGRTDPRKRRIIHGQPLQ